MPTISNENNKVTITQSTLDNLCAVDKGAEGINEYQCAYECKDSPVNCSKRCLPKLWKWKEIIVDGRKGYTNR